MVAQPHKHLTVEQYLSLERTSTIKHEYYAGDIFALAGGSEAHNLIIVNLTGMLYNHLRKHTCTVYSSDMRVKVESVGLYTYPDITIVCGTPSFEDNHRDTLLNPTVMIEVLSPSTEKYDRGKKFQNYRMIPSFREYFLISQFGYQIEHFQLRESNQWLFSEYKQPEDTVYIPSIACTLLLSDIYEKVRFNEEENEENS